MIKIRQIELLSPARNLECGIEAVKHGADAVYIGAPKFGARAAAGNSLDDISQLVSFAHLFGVKIYVTINVILKDEELSEVRTLIEQLYNRGVDALIVQDMALLQMNLPPIPLHASTQMDNRTVEKVDFLSKTGFQQVVLARELPLERIREIHTACPQVALEFFVHGALCVSFSGQCYASQACFGRSANRGECAQFCRLPFDMVDTEGKVIVRDKHLLSLKDLDLSDSIEDLLDAGVTSFKIEGRLKDAAYVKNVTAYYRQQIDVLISHRKEFVRASSGSSSYTFKPQLEKSFNRGFTHYFLNGRGEGIISPDTPKSIGELIGTVKESRGSCVVVEWKKPFHNGDGICFFDNQKHLHGFRVNRVKGNRLFFLDDVSAFVKSGTTLYRNYDKEFEDLLSTNTAVRKIRTTISLSDVPFGFAFSITDEDGHHVTITLPIAKEKARRSQSERLCEELKKTGNTPFTVDDVNISMSDDWFIPISQVADLRRRLVDELIRVRKINYAVKLSPIVPTRHPFPVSSLTYLGNVMNKESENFYHQHGVQHIEPAFEKQELHSVPVMFTKHCLRYTMGWCPRYQSKESPYKEPYYLVMQHTRRFQLEFDCKNCQMKVIAL